MWYVYYMLNTICLVTETKMQLEFLLYPLLHAFNRMLHLQSAFSQHTCQPHLLDEAMHLEKSVFVVLTSI